MTAPMQLVEKYQEVESVDDMRKEVGTPQPKGNPIPSNDSGVQTAFSRRSTASIVQAIVGLHKEERNWGPLKLKECLEERYPGTTWPSVNTVSAIVSEARTSSNWQDLRPVTQTAPDHIFIENVGDEVWHLDLSVGFRLGNQKRCYPLVVTNSPSRYLLGCLALTSRNAAAVETALSELFERLGTPSSIRVERVAPFTGKGFAGISGLSVRLLRRGIQLEFFDSPATKPRDGCDRALKMLKSYCTRPPAHDALAQQQKFDEFRDLFNGEPNEAIDGAYPRDLYSDRTKPISPEGLFEPTYPWHEEVAKVARNGCFRLPRVGNVYLGAAFGGQLLGLREIATGTWVVSFMETDLGFLDVATMRILPLPEVRGSRAR